MPQRLFIGIDPGLGGAVAFLGPLGVHIDDAPAIEIAAGRRRTSAPAVLSLLSIYDRPEVQAICTPDDPVEQYAVIEDVAGQAFGRQGTTAGQVMGHSVGVWEGVLVAAGISIRRVTPAAWKRHAPGGSLIGADKAASRQRVAELFPAVAGRVARVRDDGRAEALLLAAWLREQMR